MIPATIIAILFFDQFSKTILSRLLSLNTPVCLIKNFFYLTLVHNRGAAFGVLKNQVVFFIFAALVAIIAISLGLKQKNKPRIYNLALAFILAGATGNLIDRLRFGYVIDFLDFRVWPVFNFADSFITVGAVFLAWQIWVNKI